MKLSSLFSDRPTYQDINASSYPFPNELRDTELFPPASANQLNPPEARPPFSSPSYDDGKALQTSSRRRPRLTPFQLVCVLIVSFLIGAGITVVAIVMSNGHRHRPEHLG